MSVCCQSTTLFSVVKLMCIMERLLESISFEAADRADEKVVVDQAYVDSHLSDLAADEDLARYIL